MSTVSTVLTSALVSGVVALGLEVVTKPRLDGRKERILTMVRSRARFESNLLKLEVTSGMWATFEYEPDDTEQIRQLIESERKRAFDQIGSITEELVDNLPFYAFTYLGVTLPGLETNAPVLIAEYAFTVRVIALSSRTSDDKAKAIHELTKPLRTGLFGSPWHPRKRANALIELSSLIEKNTTPENAAPG